MTADGSIDCQNVPGEQEAHTAHLHFCEAVTALNVLAIGGSLVLKMFTMFEHQSVCLMFLLNVVFQQVRRGFSSVHLQLLERTMTVCGLQTISLGFFRSLSSNQLQANLGTLRFMSCAYGTSEQKLPSWTRSLVE